MSSSSMIFGTLNFILTLISIFIFIIIFILYFKLLKEERINDVSILLMMNTCLSAFLTSLMVLIMTSSNLFNGFLLINMNFCFIFGLFYDIFECSIYYSYSLQSFYRFFRIIYYRKRYLLSIKLYKILILIQWLLTILLFLPTILLNWYIHLPGEKYCLVPYSDIIASVYLIIILYSIPLIIIIIIYLLITKHIRLTTTIIQIRERERNLRDLIVIRRIVICVTILIILRFPTIIFIIFGIINGYLYYLTYAIVGLVTSICLILIGTINILITKKFKKNFFQFFHRNNNQINPAINQTISVN